MSPDSAIEGKEKEACFAVSQGEGLFLTWHDGLLALLALGRVLLGVAVRAEQLVLLGSEGLIHQRALAPRAVETGLMPVSVLIGQVLQTQTHETVRGQKGSELPCLCTVVGHGANLQHKQGVQRG